MSLTSWLTDYVFMPLNVSFRNLGKFGLILAIVINMIVIGLWHGANWTYVAFGLYHGLLFIPLILSGSFYKQKKMKVNKFGLPSFVDTLKMSGTFILVTIGLIIFRLDSVHDAFTYISRLFSPSILFSPKGMSIGLDRYIIIGISIFVLILLDWIQRNKEHGLQITGIIKSKTIRLIIYYAIIISIVLFRSSQQNFIYFQF
jgi:hypothetical protein